MSGIEVAGLAFGVLPVLIEVSKAYSSISEGLHTFRHYSKEVRSISRQLQVQNCIFQNHCRLLLRLVEDERETEIMLEDATDRRWTCRTLNERLSEVLKGSLELCRATMEETRDIIEDLKEMMREFDILWAQKQVVCVPLPVEPPTLLRTDLMLERKHRNCDEAIEESRKDLL